MDNNSNNLELSILSYPLFFMLIGLNRKHCYRSAVRSITKTIILFICMFGKL